MASFVTRLFGGRWAGQAPADPPALTDAVAVAPAGAPLPSAVATPDPDDPYVRNRIFVGEHRVTDEAELPEGVKVSFQKRSTGNLVRLSPDGKYRGVVINLGSAIDCTIEIGAIRVNFGGVTISFVANSGRCSTNAIVRIGDASVFNGATHIIGALTPGVEVSVGRDCLFASGITLRGSSHHGLWDKQTGELLNPEEGLRVGDHVWVGDQVVMLNKASIAAGCVVAARSIVNKPFDEEDSMLAGAPAKVRRSGVAWTHEFPADNGEQPRDLPLD